MTKHGAAWLPRALYTRLASWCAQTSHGQIVLNLCDGHITSYKLIEHGRVVRQGAEYTLDTVMEAPAEQSR